MDSHKTETISDARERDAKSSSAFEAGKAKVHVCATLAESAAAASSKAASLISEAVKTNGSARVIAATGNSQKAFIDNLVNEKDVPWDRVTLFHMDEYLGIPATHPASFRFWIRTRIEERVHPKQANYIEGDARDPDAEITRYQRLLLADEIDVAFVGIGENGHIAFNDPPVADFHDPKTVKRVTLDAACKRQQAGEGHFESLAAVPDEAITITCPGLFRAKAWVTVVPDERKAKAVAAALEGPVTTECPASLIRLHPNATIYLDRSSAYLLKAK